VEHCVITGSSSGIGLALSKRLLAKGWKVTGLDMAGPSETLSSSQYFHEQIALEDPTALELVCADLAKSTVTAIVHCAGIVRASSIEELSREDAALMWKVHVDAGMFLVSRLSRNMPNSRGRIVLVSSRAVLGRANRAAYSASKSALIGLARALAAEFVTRGITVNVVAPGATDTPMLRDPKRGLPPMSTLPMGRLITAEEVSASIEFF
jgi:3-oxoacyl-[acyl-carrier protein] reductase